MLRDKLDADAFEVLALYASRVGAFRKSLDVEGFRNALSALHMPEQEVQEFWDAADLRACGQCESVKTNTDLSCLWGVLLDSKRMPRNFLLYRITAQLFPHIVSVQMRVIPHRAAIAEGRWEHIMDGKKRVVQLSFLQDVAPKKRSKKTGRRRRSAYERFGSLW